MVTTKLIKETIGKVAEAADFLYGGRDLEGWKYVKQEDGVKLTIYVSITRGMYRELRMELLSTAYGRTPVCIAGEMINDIKNFKITLMEFADILKHEGIPSLLELSKPTSEIHPTEEMYNELFRNHAILSKKYMEKHGINKIESLEKVCNRIFTELQIMNQMDSDIHMALIEMAAYLGNGYVENYGGEWLWIKKYSTCIVSKTDIYLINPLATVIGTFIDHNEYILNQFYSNKKLAEDK